MSTKAHILKHALLPGFIPRIAELFRSGFMHTAYIIAVIYRNVGLLPHNHPYLAPENIGRFGVRHVIAETANNLVFTRKNIDQIFIFFTVLAGLVLLILQFILLILALTAQQPAFALALLGGDVTNLFNNPNGATGSAGPDQDIAFIVLDRVFGVRDVFDSCISNTAVACLDLNNNPLPNQITTYPFPFHIALHRLLQFYSYGIFFIGALVIIYFIITITSETAATGTPFGQRFNKAWAPIRFILFFGFLVPLTLPGSNAQGLNLAQMTTLSIVKLGSNMASNGWALFNGGGSAAAGPSDGYMSQQKDIVAVPTPPEVLSLLQTIFIARTCQAAYGLEYGDDPDYQIDAYIVRTTAPSTITPPTVNGPVATPNAIGFGAPYNNATNFAYNGNIIIRFGVLGTTDIYNKYMGNVKPLCGEITMPTTADQTAGSNIIFEGYYNLINTIWTDNDFITYAECYAQKNTQKGNDPNCANLPDLAWVTTETTTYEQTIQTFVDNGVATQRAAGEFNMPPELVSRGWAGASIWYNRIAEMNGAMITAVQNMPKASRVPFLMQAIFVTNKKQNENVISSTLFNQNMADGEGGLNVIADITDQERNVVNAMGEAYDFWNESGATPENNYNKQSSNIIISFINTVFGTSGLFEMRDNTDVHPLAQLTAMGKGLMDASLRNLGYSVLLSAGGTTAQFLKLDPTMLKSLSGFLQSVGLITIGMSAILYYVIPLLPFIYFMFAVSGWVKSIFEAIVAIPLWVLAHLRIDGEGLPGPGASNGYFLLLEIFLRPILIVFGFLASITIFSALVSVLNEIFDLVVANVNGFNDTLELQIQSGAATESSYMDFARSSIDEFFFTVMYTIIVYIMALATFKLVDLIPNSILRWTGVSVTTFQENAGDPAGQLTGNIYKGSLLVTRGVQGDLAVLAA